MENEQNTTTPEISDLKYPPKPVWSAHIDENNSDAPDAVPYWEAYRDWCHQICEIEKIEKAQEERLARIKEERDSLDLVVFNLTRAFENLPASTFCDYAGMLDRNARILNAGFEYYLDRAAESPKADQKIRLAIQMQSQLVRTIDAWRRLEDFQNRGTK